MRFDLTDLRLFLAVADAGSITHGAAEAGLSLPAASERLRNMEEAGQVRLLDRGRRGVVLTEAGEALAHHARTILHQMALMKGELGEYARAMRATVRVLANTAAIVEVLPKRLAPWMAANPRTDIELKERQSVEIARGVASGFADIGILSDSAARDDLLLRPFAVDRLVLVVAAGHSFAARKEIRFVEVADEFFIGLAGGALQDHIDAQAERIGVRLKQRVKLRTFDAICELAGAGAGIGIVPEAAARRFRRAAGLAVVRLADNWATRNLSVCVRRGGALTPAGQSLFDHLASEIRLSRGRASREDG